MSVILLCQDPERLIELNNIHKPLRKMVRKSGWYVSICAWDDDNLIFSLYQTWPNKALFTFKDSYDNRSILVEAIENKFYEITNQSK